MKFINKSEIFKSHTNCKKSFFIDVRFLIIVFALIFVVLGITTVNVLAGTDSIINPNNPSDGFNPTNQTDETTVFSFKSGNKSTLYLTTDSEPVTDYLIISNQNSVSAFLLTDDDGNVDKNPCIQVSIKPFVIKVSNVGQTWIHLTAEMPDQNITTISLKVIVTDNTNQDSEQPNTDQTEKTKQKFVLDCKIVDDFGFLKELVFSLTPLSSNDTQNNVLDEQDITDVPDFTLSYQIIQGFVSVSIFKYNACITFLTSDTCCSIKFVAHTKIGDFEFLYIT